jgi:hypothetical protein
VCPHTHTCVSSSLLIDIYPDSYFYVYVLMPKKTKLPYTGGTELFQLGAPLGLGGACISPMLRQGPFPRPKK